MTTFQFVNIGEKSHQVRLPLTFDLCTMFNQDSTYDCFVAHPNHSGVTEPKPLDLVGDSH